MSRFIFVWSKKKGPKPLLIQLSLGVMGDMSKKLRPCTGDS